MFMSDGLSNTNQKNIFTMRTKEKNGFITLLFSLILVAGFNPAQAQQTENTVVDVISQSEDHTILAELLVETELDNIISQPGSYTVIAPTDEAFQEMGSELDALRENSQELQNVILGHLFQGEVSAEEAGPVLGVEIEQGDIPASNGVVHTTNQVIMAE